MFRGSSGFLFGSESSPVLAHQSLDCFVVVVICGCESFVAQVDYCVCGVRLFILLVSCFLAGLRLGEFLTRNKLAKTRYIQELATPTNRPTLKPHCTNKCWNRKCPTCPNIPRYQFLSTTLGTTHTTKCNYVHM